MAITDSKYDTDFQRGIEELGLSQRQAALFFGKTEKTIRNYASGRTRPDHSVMMIIEFCRRHCGFKGNFKTISDDLHTRCGRRKLRTRKVQNG